MAGLYWYTIFVVVVAISICVAVHYASHNLSDNIRKLIIILSIFAILGVTTHRSAFCESDNK